MKRYVDVQEWMILHELLNRSGDVLDILLGWWKEDDQKTVEVKTKSLKSKKTKIIINLNYYRV